MGGCLRTHRHGSNRDSGHSGGVGKNQSLKPEKPRWKSEIPLTQGQLRSKRDEFWDTAPAFEGRKEIWDALRAAAQMLENGDHQLAQAVIDGANITLPNGTLLDCYDELGNRYQLPVYVLSMPTNLVDESSEGDTNSGNDEGILGTTEPTDPGTQLPIKFRLAPENRDVKVMVNSNDTVLKVKRQVQDLTGAAIPLQRWFFGGRLLTDKMTIESAKITKGCLVQIVLREPPTVQI